MSKAIVEEIQKRNEEELELLDQAIKRLGKENADGTWVVTFGVLFKDDWVANTFEGLSATLKNAKNRGIVKYNSPLLMQGAHNDVEILLLKK